jgi:hypothetical protein
MFHIKIVASNLDISKNWRKILRPTNVPFDFFSKIKNEELFLPFQPLKG